MPKDACSVHLSDEHTTMTLPHRKFCVGGDTYYVATFPEGDLAIHRSFTTNKEGYGGSLVRFLMEDGAHEDVLGPFECQGLFDHGLRERLRQELGGAAELSATRLVLGRNLSAYSSGPREEIFAEEAMSCRDVRQRLAAACAALGPAESWPADLQCYVHTRSGARVLRKDEIEEALEREERRKERSTRR